MALLHVAELTRRFGGLVANDRINMDVDEGEIVGLIGPNGAGKTTLFNCIAGFYHPSSGKVVFQGQDITGWSPHRACHAGLARTFQVVRTFKDMTVLDNVMVGAFCRVSSRAKARDEALKVLEFTGLLAKRNARGGSLTIADKKRLEMARALASGPRLIMLDEVMAGLTSTEVADAVEIVQAIRRQGTAILMVEHVLEAIMPISDRIVVLDNGRKIAEGAPAEVSRNAEVIRAYLGEEYRA